MDTLKNFDGSLSCLAATAALLAGLAGCGGVSSETTGTSSSGSGGLTSSGGAGGSGGLSGSGGAGGSAGSPVVIGPVPVALDVQATHVLADPVHATFLALVGEKAASHTNSLVVIEAATGAILSSTEVGPDPAAMALSDDGSTLWVGFHGVSTIRRVDLSSGAPVLGDSYSVPAIDPSKALVAEHMVVLPGTTDSVAVTLIANTGYGYAGTVVMDGGVARPKHTSSGGMNLVAGPEGWLFASDANTSSPFYVIEIATDGLTKVLDEDGVIFGGSDNQLVYSGGRLYTSASRVLDVSAPEAPKKVGNFAYAGPSLHLVPSKERAVLLSLEKPKPGAAEITLRYLDTSTFWLADGKTFTNVAADSVRDLATADEKVFAFVGESQSGGGRLYLVENPFAE